MLLKLQQQIARSVFRKNYSDTPLRRGQLAPAQAKAIRFIEKLPALHKMPPWLARKNYVLADHLFSVDRCSIAKVKDHKLEHMKIREYSPISDSENRPALVYFHGGGCAIGNLESHDLFCRYVAKKTAYTVLSVDYRLGPEFKFPCAIVDAIQAWNWIHTNSEKLGIDPKRIGVGGDSAGAYLATLLCIQVSDPSLEIRPLAMPNYQWLIYPMLDLRGNSESYQNCTSGMLLTQDLMNYFRDHYLNSPEERENPLASPLLTNNLENLPDAYVLTVGHDPLMDDGLVYAERLEEAGNQTTHEHYEHQMHGFISFGGICPYALETIDKSIDQLMKLNISSRHLGSKKEEQILSLA